MSQSLIGSELDWVRVRSGQSWIESEFDWVRVRSGQADLDRRCSSLEFHWVVLNWSVS